jgi:hypothetical protein
MSTELIVKDVALRNGMLLLAINLRRALLTAIAAIDQFVEVLKAA